MISKEVKGGGICDGQDEGEERLEEGPSLTVSHESETDLGYAVQLEVPERPLIWTCLMLWWY